MYSKEWEFIATHEHKQQARRLPQSLERTRLAKPITTRPNWMTRQTARLLNDLGYSIVSLSRRLENKQDVQ